jgi:signal transduction histidine kinase
MLFAIRKMSLRTRLILLTVAVIGALAVASFVAWRLARATQAFVVRQAEASVQTAAGDLVRDLREHPEGRTTLEEPASSPTGKPRPPQPKKPPPPPHEVKAFQDYSDPYARLTAIALHKQKEISGGFCRADGSLAGYAFPAYQGTGLSAGVPADAVQTIREMCRQAAQSGELVARTIHTSELITTLAAAPASAKEETSEASQSSNATPKNLIIAAWTMQRMSPLKGATDATNLIALIALACVVVIVAGLSLMTVRDLRHGVGDIEAGLANLKTDLDHSIAAPRVPELARIVAAVNELAAALRLNIAKQRDLERDLRKSERLAALGRVVAGVAHEVRNPLSAMKLKLQMARRGDYAREKLDETFRVVLEESERLERLVRRLLELARPDALHLTKFDLNELVRERASLFAERAARQNVKVKIETASDEMLIAGDHDRLAQALDNLIQNALEAMSDGGALTIKSAQAEKERGAAHEKIARLEIADTGAGIAPEDCEHIFEPFYTGRKMGTGLGLAIAREIIEAHNGRINFENDAAKGGARFFIELPLISKNDETNKQTSNARAGETIEAVGRTR